MNRRSFLTTSGAAVVAATIPDAGTWQAPRAKARFRTGLVAYSYRQALQAKTMTYEDLIRIAVETGTDGIDKEVLPTSDRAFQDGGTALAPGSRASVPSMTRVRIPVRSQQRL